jgi:excisionase family DNA binding protein
MTTNGRSDGPLPLLLTAGEVAGLLGVTRDWIYEQSRAGQIPHVKLGRYYRYRLETIESWMRELERASVKPTVLNGPKATPPGPTKGGSR